MVKRRIFRCAVSLIAIGLATAPGCTSGEPSMRERQDAAIRDPFSYGSKSEPRSVSGGSTSEFDRDAFKRDVNRALNP